MKLSVPTLVLAAVALAACSAPTAPKPVVTPTTTPTSTSAELPPDSAPQCELTCQAATLTAGAPSPGPDHHGAAVENVDAVFAAMHDDLLACYRAQIVKTPSARAFVLLDLVLNADGSVRKVESSGGGMLGDAGLRCLTRRVERATFAPVHGGGTLHVQVPLVFRSLTPTETL